MKTKPFNLSEALAGAKVVTRDGREVTQLHRFEMTTEDSLAGVLEGRLFAWRQNGSHFMGGDINLFLLDEPKKITLYGVTAFYAGGGYYDGYIESNVERRDHTATRWKGSSFTVVTFEHEVEVPGERE